EYTKNLLLGRSLISWFKSPIRKSILYGYVVFQSQYSCNLLIPRGHINRAHPTRLPRSNVMLAAPPTISPSLQMKHFMRTT
ncbi:hypothetical protein, partial [Methylomonas lenta]|uniref:hypothetical protein n=1 Tax=Methylomonas lenta TaxID=980561 RepID=UPI001E469357